MARSILVIDDEQGIRDTLKGALEDEGYKVTCCESGPTGLAEFEKNSPDIILLDIWMPEMDGLEVLKHVKERDSSQVVIMMSGHGTIETAVKATKLGAFDFVEKPLSLEKLLVLTQNAIAARNLSVENKALKEQSGRPQVRLIGESPGIKDIRDKIKQVAPTRGSVLILGENGTGKELVAQSIHAMSPRFGNPFIAVNCAAIPEELIESELFGHEKGAFTGAIALRRGKFDLANEGTLFLDEIADMSLKTQAKILRILQEQMFERVGGTKTISVDVRIVAATNKDLKEEIKAGTFREDLFYRLNVVPFQIPPLRDRKDDIFELCELFLEAGCRIHGKGPREMSGEGLKVLQNYSWPGNVRELKNLMERIVILTTSDQERKPIAASDIFDHLSEGADTEPDSSSEGIALSGKLEQLPKNLKAARLQFEKEFILKILDENDGNISKTSTVLGIERSHLSRKIKALRDGE